MRLVLQTVDCNERRNKCFARFEWFPGTSIASAHLYASSASIAMRWDVNSNNSRYLIPIRIDRDHEVKLSFDCSVECVWRAFSTRTMLPPAIVAMRFCSILVFRTFPVFWLSKISFCLLLINVIETFGKYFWKILNWTQLVVQYWMKEMSIPCILVSYICIYI